MADCQPVQNCKSTRCAQAGVCNCLLVYSDGTPVSGAGTGSNPYVIERAPITCIIDASGSQLIPDANRCVTLPTAVARVVSADTGQEYLPDVLGRVTLPTAGISSLNFIDIDGNILEVESGDFIKFQLDGDDGLAQDIEYPIVDDISKTVTFPTIKTSTTKVDRITIWDGVNFQVNLGNISAANTPTLKQTRLHIALQIYNDDPLPNQVYYSGSFKFNLSVQNPNVFEPINIITSGAYWSSGPTNGYTSYFFTTDHLFTNYTSTQFKMEILQTELTASTTNILADYQVVAEWL